MLKTSYHDKVQRIKTNTKTLLQIPRKLIHEKWQMKRKTTDNFLIHSKFKKRPETLKKLSIYTLYKTRNFYFA